MQQITPATIFVSKFWTTYTPAPTPDNPLAMKEEDWVAYSPMGSADRSVIVERVRQLGKLLPLGDGTSEKNPAIVMAHMRWAAIKPRYDAWKAGQAAPTTGTPLAAWNGVTPEQADVFRMAGVHTVEDISVLSDAHVQRMHIPGLREVIANAKRFLEAADRNVVTVALAKKDEEISTLKAQMEEMADMMKEMMAQQQAQPEKRGPGRPPQGG